MGLIHFIIAWAQIPAKRRFMASMGFHQNRKGDWIADFGGEYLYKQDFRRWTLGELKKNYTGFRF